MRRSRCLFPAVTLLAACWGGAVAYGQLTYTAFDVDHPAIAYHSTASTDAVAVLNGRLQSGAQQLQFDGPSGYLRSLLRALDIPVESQMAVYSKTSLQSRLISPKNPRTIFFNDSTAVGWVPGGFIEVAAQDPRQGTVFYILDQTPVPVPRLAPDARCLGCHMTVAAEGVPGFIVRSIPTAAGGEILPWLGNFNMDHSSPLPERWGGWYVTANKGLGRHLGNAFLQSATALELPAWNPDRNLRTLNGLVTAETALTAHSDVVALLVFEHQVRLMNLLTRIGWESRVAAQEPGAPASNVQSLANVIADYMLFVGEAQLEGIEGSSAFTTRFAAAGVRDRRGRSLRDLDLRGRLMRYPLSYMIYSDVFDALPMHAQDAIYRRLWAVLSGEDPAPTYSRLSKNDRQAIVEILRDTKPDLPGYFLAPN